jgi:hypothetical protein
VSALAQSFLRLDRAVEQLDELRRQIASYVDANREFSVIRVEGNTVTPRFPAEQPTPKLGIRVGEIIYQIRATLDHLVFQMAWSDSGQTNFRTQFPIEDTPEGFRGRIKPIKRRKGFVQDNWLTGVSADHVKAIEELQPYKGVDWTKILRELSNEDKHRTLNLLGVSGAVFPSAPLRNVRSWAAGRRSSGRALDGDASGT